MPRGEKNGLCGGRRVGKLGDVRVPSWVARRENVVSLPADQLTHVRYAGVSFYRILPTRLSEECDGSIEVSKHRRGDKDNGIPSRRLED